LATWSICFALVSKHLLSCRRSRVRFGRIVFVTSRTSLGPVCPVGNVSLCRDRGAVGMGAALAATTAGPGSTGFYPGRGDLLRSVRVSATARYGWRAQTDSAKRANRKHSLQPIISVPPEADNRTQTIVTPSDIKLNHDVASAQYRRVVAKQSPARDAAGINRNAELENTDASCSCVVATRAGKRCQPIANRHTTLSQAAVDADCRRECGVFTHSAGPTGRDRPASAQRGRRFAAQFGRHQHRALASSCAQRRNCPWPSYTRRPAERRQGSAVARAHRRGPATAFDSGQCWVRIQGDESSRLAFTPRR